MAVGCIIGIEPSYIESASDVARSYVEAVNRGLEGRGLPAYSEPSAIPEPYVGPLFGRSALDHESARFLAQLGGTPATTGYHSPNLELLAVNPYRVAFVPGPVFTPFATGHVEDIGGDPTNIWVGSLTALFDELIAVAPRLAIPLQGSELADETAARINDCAPLSDHDHGDPTDGRRSAWLLLHEATRHALRHSCAVCLAG